MNKLNYLVPIIICYFLSLRLLNAQTPADAIMMQSREICGALTYEYGFWDQYWEGSLLRSNATIATLNRSAVSPMAAIGLTNRVNLLVSTPYITTWSSEPNGGKFAGAKGLQDLSVVFKTKLIQQPIGKGEILMLSSMGFSTPTTNYLSDYRPYSIGFGANEVNFRGILQYQWQSGWYIRSSLAHRWRGMTQAERDYYYNNGSYYTSWMDVPNAWDYDLVTGIWLLDNTLRLEINYNRFRSTSGDDIRAYNAGQPTNKVNSDQVGFFAQHYLKQVKGLGFLCYFSQFIYGRNTGKASIFGLGTTYQFHI